MRHWKVTKVISTEVDARTAVSASNKARKLNDWLEEQLHVEEVDLDEDEKPIDDPKKYIL